MTGTTWRRASARPLVGAALAATAALAIAACGSSNSSSTQPKSASGGSPKGGTAVATANVNGVGTVLVNGDGRTLYILTSEKGGKLTCTDDNGCTKVWPDTELPHGTTHATAGPGARASLLGTVKSKDGSLYVTYAGYPLYTYARDTASGQAKGQGIKSFGGTWWAISPSGALVTKTASSSSGSGNSPGY
jgi:predicted lipoprotein with Yx(FWY)xxD motif